jgi:hypothetical protein
VLLSVYALLPETLRFSRGILVFGSLVAFVLMTSVRWWLVNLKVISRDEKDEEHRQTFIVGTEKEFEEVNSIMKHAGMQERVLGRVDVNGSHVNALGEIENLKPLLSTYSIKEVIFCEGYLSLKSIIEIMKDIPKQVRMKFHTANASGIIGSDSKSTSGKFISADRQINLSLPVSRRNKNLIDFLISIFFIITFPVHLFVQKKPGNFFKNVFDVLLLKKTWVGYSFNQASLPKIKKGILTTTGLPASLNTLPPESLAASDKWYATDYDVFEDLKIVWRRYKFLGP